MKGCSNAHSCCSSSRSDASQADTRTSGTSRLARNLSGSEAAHAMGGRSQSKPSTRVKITSDPDLPLPSVAAVPGFSVIDGLYERTQAIAIQCTWDNSHGRLTVGPFVDWSNRPGQHRLICKPHTRPGFRFAAEARPTREQPRGSRTPGRSRGCQSHIGAAFRAKTLVHRKSFATSTIQSIPPTMEIMGRNRACHRWLSQPLRQPHRG